MTVSYLGEITGERSATNSLGKRSYTRAFKLTTSTTAEGAYAVGSHASLPNIGAVFPDDSSAWCVSLDVKNSDPWKGWTVTAEYNSDRELAIDPTTEPAIVRISTEQFQKVVEVDINGDSICNSAGDPFDPPFMMDDSRRVVSITKNMSGIPSWILNYADTVNSDAFTIKGITYSVGQGKVQRVAIGEEQTRNGVPFVVVELDIHLQRDGWILKPLDVGFRQLAYDATTRINITNDDNSLPPAPVPLNGLGKVLANPSSATAIYGASVIYQTAVFSVLPLT